MKHYLVKWSIDIDADSPEEAAKQALVIQRDPQSIATHYVVHEVGNKNAPVELYIDMA